MCSQIKVNNKIDLHKTIKIAPFKKDIRKTTPHKHKNYFEIIYLSQGSGYHFIDLGKYKVEPPIMYFIRQEQVHYWELDSEPEGYVVIIKKPFIEDCFDQELKKLFIDFTNECCLRLKNQQSIELLMKLLVDENDKAGKNSILIIQGLLKALLAKVHEEAVPVNTRRMPKSDLYHSFIAILGSSNGIKSKIQFYADQLNTSPQNLNAACRKAANQSATEVLSEFVLSEAKRLLLYTEKTVSEISFALEFADSSYFVKYFKRLTGQTPLEFKQAKI
jgi:AraC-like DNA-binding protein